MIFLSPPRRFGWYATVAVLSIVHPSAISGWGFLAHREINEKAIYLLPPKLLAFYKEHVTFIREEAVKPDKRRYVVEGEARCHYINLEPYHAEGALAHDWQEATRRYDEAFLDSYGILPWHIVRTKQRLTRAFREKDIARILRLSADLGHYGGDAHVPLHTSENYDGQLTDQHGVHGLWETRLPTLFLDEYDFLFPTKATYIPDVQTAIWDAILHAHQLAEEVLAIERALDATFPTMEKYCYERRGTTLVRTYTRAYAHAYHQALGGMVEQQMRASIHMVASLWLTCWIDAGCPDLTDLGPIIEPLDPDHESPEDFLLHNPQAHACEGE